MSTGTGLIALGAFLASAVEMVEALTIVLGVGTVRGWRSTLIGVGAATIVLAVLIAVLGPALQHIPLDSLRLVVGALLLVFGLQWLRKAILRSSGFKGLHDEDEAFRRERAEAEAAGSERRAGLDWYAFTICFKGVLLEGLEVVFIVVGFAAGSAGGGPATPRGAPAVAPRGGRPRSSSWWSGGLSCTVRSRACPRTSSSTAWAWRSRPTACSGSSRG